VFQFSLTAKGYCVEVATINFLYLREASIERLRSELAIARRKNRNIGPANDDPVPRRKLKINSYAHNLSDMADAKDSAHF